MEPFSQYAVAATGEAIAQAGLDMEKRIRSARGNQHRFRYRKLTGDGT
ncbi:hypothetical protein [Clostridium sp.]